VIRASVLSFLLAEASANINLNYWRILMSNNKTPMTPKAAARIQSSEAKKCDGKIAKGSFAAKAMRIAAKNSHSDKQGSN
jgi:hypothetical protein